MIILFVLLPSRRVSDPFQRSMQYRIHPLVVFAILQYLWRRLYQDKEFYLVFQFLTGRNLRSQNSVQPLLGLHKYKHKYKRKYKHKSWSRICQFSIKPCNHCCCRDSDCHPHDNQSHFSRCVGAFSCVCRRAFDSLRSRPLFFLLLLIVRLVFVFLFGCFHCSAFDRRDGNDLVFIWRLSSRSRDDDAEF